MAQALAIGPVLPLPLLLSIHTKHVAGAHSACMLGMVGAQQRATWVRTDWVRVTEQDMNRGGRGSALCLPSEGGFGGSHAFWGPGTSKNCMGIL